MIIDIIDIPFKGKSLQSYNGIVPVFMTDLHLSQDDYYPLGFSTNKPIPEMFHRYKIIEICDNTLFEHIVLSEKPIDVNRPTKQHKYDTQIYVLTTRMHGCINSTKQKLFKNESVRYIQTINQLLFNLNFNRQGIQSVHQVILNVLGTLLYNNRSAFKAYPLLQKYISDRKPVLDIVTTPSVHKAIESMLSINEIYTTLAAYWTEESDTDSISYLDGWVNLPIPPKNSVIYKIMERRPYVLLFSDLVAHIHVGQYGCIKPFLSQRPLIDLDSIQTVNGHLCEDKTPEESCGLLEVLTDIELCHYTDFSLEMQYSATNSPNIHLYYGGSVLSTVENPNIALGDLYFHLNIPFVYETFKRFYGKRFDIDKPNIRICRTFEEDVYLTYTVKNKKGQNVEKTHYFDLTLISILSPVVLDETNEMFVRRQLFY